MSDLELKINVSADQLYRINTYLAIQSDKFHKAKIDNETTIAVRKLYEQLSKAELRLVETDNI